MPKADFHIHTTMSDGALTPTEIVKKYKNEEYDIIAITDHDGIDGVREAQIAGEALEIQVIGGIEFSTCIRGKDLRNWGMDYRGKRGLDMTGPEPDEFGLVKSTDDEVGVHLLGYYFDLGDKRLAATLEKIRECRYDRNMRLIEALRKMGCELTYEELREGRKNDFIGKPVIARMLVKKGYIQTPAQAFEDGKFLESEEAQHIEKNKVDTLAAIDIINCAGGVPVVAHPMKIKHIGDRTTEEFWKNLEIIIKGLKKSGLKGLECFHPNHSHDESIRLVSLAEKYHLHITQGSDFHGNDFK